MINDDTQAYGGWGAHGWPATEDQAFLLSYQEVLEYYPEKADRVCQATAYAIAEGADTKVTWWLRSPGYGNCAALVLPNGDLHYNYYSHPGYSARPVIWVDLTAEIFA